jgi:hypothetical protein
VENLSFEDAPTVRIEAQMLGLISMVGEVRPLAVAAAGPKAGQSVEVTLTFVVDRAQNPHRLLLILRSYTMDPSFRDNSIEVAVVPS